MESRRSDGSRWSRLRPADATDLVLTGVGTLGLLLSALFRMFPDGVDVGNATVGLALSALASWHGSTPALTFLAGAVYLTRRGRAIGTRRRWVWAGFAATVPLWLLVGLPISARGLGDVTWLFLSLNLVGAGLMGVGVAKTLRA